MSARCRAYWTHYTITWACPCGAVYRDECKAETWKPSSLSDDCAPLGCLQIPVCPEGECARRKS